MYMEEPIKLSLERFDLLMEDTDRHRICWMYHDVLSDQQIARLFARLARTEAEDWENQTVMAWVAPCQQENGYYLLFKWYDDFYDPPERIDLYVVRYQPGSGGEPVVQPVQMGFVNRLSERGKSRYRNQWGMVSENVVWFFGEADFEEDAMLHILRHITEDRGREMEVFERYYRHRADGELALQCRAIEGYFRTIQVVDETVRAILPEYEGREENDTAQGLWGILERMSTVVDLKQIGSYALSFARMADGFFRQPVRAPELNRNAAQQLFTLTDRGEIRWSHLKSLESQEVLRELYFRCNPSGSWDVFLPWQGEVYATVLRRSAGRELHRGVYILARSVDHRGRFVTDLFWLENTMGCLPHLCGGDFFGELLDRVRAGYVREAELPELQEDITVEQIYHRMKDFYEDVEEKTRRRQ